MVEIDDVIVYVIVKCECKGCDWIVVNDVSFEIGIMGGLENVVMLIFDDGVESWLCMGKDVVVEELVVCIVKVLVE